MAVGAQLLSFQLVLTCKEDKPASEKEQEADEWTSLCPLQSVIRRIAYLEEDI